MSDLIERHHAAMGAGAPLFYDEPVTLARGDGVWLEETDGNRYLDLYNNVPCVGHANPHVARAIGEQMATLNVHSRYLHPTVVVYVERLLALHHDGIESAVLACSGTEATELALTMIRMATGRHGIIATDATYHGNSSLVGRLSRLPRGEDRGGVKSISTPQTYRPLREGATETELLQLHLDELASTIASFDDEGGFAGIMLCSILANEGLPNPPAGWFDEAIAMVRDAGGLVIADEVQAGFGRSGRWWGYEANDFTPDIVCMGKPMGNGLPLSGVASSHDLISRFRTEKRYFNTFASSPLQAAVGLAVLDEIEERGLVENADRVGTAMKAALVERLDPERRPWMADVRGVGLFLGVEIVTGSSGCRGTSA